MGDETRKVNSELQIKNLLTGLLQAVLLTCGLLWCTALLFSHPLYRNSGQSTPPPCVF